MRIEIRCCLLAPHCDERARAGSVCSIILPIITRAIDTGMTALMVLSSLPGQQEGSSPPGIRRPIYESQGLRHDGERSERRVGHRSKTRLLGRASHLQTIGASSHQ